MDKPESKKNYLCPMCGSQFDEPKERYAIKTGRHYSTRCRTGELKNDTDKTISGI